MSRYINHSIIEEINETNGAIGKNSSTTCFQCDTIARKKLTGIDYGWGALSVRRSNQKGSKNFPMADAICGDTRGSSSPRPNKKRKSGSVLDLVIAAVRQLKSHSGSSLVAISKVLEADGCCNETAIKRAVKAGVEKGVLVKVKNSYQVAGEIYEDISDKVVTEDVELGDGDGVVAGDVVTISYTGRLAFSGSTFDSGKLSFAVGQGDVIKGMDRGVLGMRVGGKRKIIIPSSLGYGKRGSADIPPNSDLVFVVGLKSKRGG
jgi:FKBP-type peptidyl-prolyl cis-trans isomerase